MTYDLTWSDPKGFDLRLVLTKFRLYVDFSQITWNMTCSWPQKLWFSVCVCCFWTKPLGIPQNVCCFWRNMADWPVLTIPTARLGQKRLRQSCLVLGCVQSQFYFILFYKLKHTLVKDFAYVGGCLHCNHWHFTQLFFFTKWCKYREALKLITYLLVVVTQMFFLWNQ